MVSLSVPNHESSKQRRTVCRKSIASRSITEMLVRSFTRLFHPSCQILACLSVFVQGIKSGVLAAWCVRSQRVQEMPAGEEVESKQLTILLQIVCYDVSKSPIRLVQRMGRTGRKRAGRIIVLVTEVRPIDMSLMFF